MNVMCNICGTEFVNRSNLVRHLNDKRCRGDLLKFNKLIIDTQEHEEMLIQYEEKLHQEELQLQKKQELQERLQQEVKVKELVVEEVIENQVVKVGELVVEKEIQVVEVEELVVEELVVEVEKLTIIEIPNQLTFSGIFEGREHEIRITSDKMISVFDFIKVVSGQENPRVTWNNIKKKYKNEVVGFLYNLKFPGSGQKLTPVVNVQGMVKLLFWLPGELAKQFRSKSAETMIRYLGGDLTLIDEIKTIDQQHIDNPNNIAQVFRDEIQPHQIQSLFNQDQINTSKQLINYFGNKNDIFYMFSFKFAEDWYAKYGIVGELRELYLRVQEHKSEFNDICFHNIIQCSNIDKVESDFKDTALVKMNRVKIPKKNGGNHVEVLKLSELITTGVIRDEMIKVAGDRMLDPLPPSYQEIETNDLVIEQEHTKQMEIELRQKEIEYKELTKQKEIELEIKKLDLEMKKMEYEVRKLELTK